MEPGILFDFEVIECNDWPHDVSPAEFGKKGKTARLLLCLTK
jgi:hypothetical protein